MIGDEFDQELPALAEIELPLLARYLLALLFELLDGRRDVGKAVDVLLRLRVVEVILDFLVLLGLLVVLIDGDAPLHLPLIIGERVGGDLDLLVHIDGWELLHEVLPEIRCSREGQYDRLLLADVDRNLYLCPEIAVAERDLLDHSDYVSIAEFPLRSLLAVGCLVGAQLRPFRALRHSHVYLSVRKDRQILPVFAWCHWHICVNLIVR